MGFINTITPYKLNLDFKQNKIETINIHQYDKDGRTILVTCSDNGIKTSIDYLSITARVKWMKPDNLPVFNDCIVNEDGTITIQITEQMSITSGTVNAELMLSESASASILHTMPFKVIVAKGVFSNTTVTSSYEFDALNEALSDLDGIVTTIEGHITNKSNPHEVNKIQIGLENVTNEKQIPLTQKGSSNGVCPLGSDSKVDAVYLPSYVDDVLEYSSISNFPSTGESGKIYVNTTTNLTYRWSGSSYVEISQSLAIGETSSTAYRGDRGKIAYEHSITSGNPHGMTKANIGLENVDNTSDINKPLSTATKAIISDEYSASSTYAVGALVIYNNTLYKCTTAITTAEAWNSAHWAATTVDNEIVTINNNLSIKSVSEFFTVAASLIVSEQSATVSGKIINVQLRIRNSDSSIFPTERTTLGTIIAGYRPRIGQVITCSGSSAINSYANRNAGIAISADGTMYADIVSTDIRHLYISLSYVLAS